MDRKIYQLIFVIIFLLSFTMRGQNSLEKETEKDVTNYAYIDVIEISERVAKKGYISAKLYRNIGDSYYFNGKLIEAKVWYEKLIRLVNEVNLEIPSEYYYRYAQSLKAIGNLKEANFFLERFSVVSKQEIRSQLIRDTSKFLQEIKENSGRYELSLLKINSSFSDYGSTVYQDQLIFTSARDTGNITKKIHNWTGQSFTSLYAAPIQENGEIYEFYPFAKEIRSKFNESTLVFTRDGNTMYFTRNNYLKGKGAKNGDKLTLLKIYRASLIEGRWSNVEELPFNSDEFNTAHPALSPDGKWMYFSSDREGGCGQSDLYKIEFTSDGFGNPINLGKDINTEGRETFPFITDNNELYFSSDGRPGLGGLDIYVAKIKEDGSLSPVQNIGQPANSEFDDFGFYINSQTNRGFLSSNRSRGQNDNIYSFIETQALSLDCKQNIKGVVYDEITKEPLIDADIFIFDSNEEKIGYLKSSADGEFVFSKLICGVTYRLRVIRNEYQTVEKIVNLSYEEGTTNIDLYLDKAKVFPKKGDDLFKALSLDPIYFDFDKSDIRSDSATELAKVVEVLQQYPEMKIDVRSHTDSRGNNTYNLKLSERRAQSTIKWIIDRGIDPSRVIGKGYGSTHLLNDCKKGIPCSVDQHQKNRRSEFIILSL